MIITRAEGKYNSYAICTDCLRPVTILVERTDGVVTDEIEQRFMSKAEKHEQRHPGHDVTITFYRVNLEPIEEQSDPNLPLLKSMQEARKAYLKSQGIE